MNKQTPLIILLPVIGILEVILAFEDDYLLINYVHLEMVIVAGCGYLGIKRGMWLLLALFYGWVFITGSIEITFFAEYAATEAVLFGMLVFWIYRRPERVPSDPPSDTVQIAFYYGDKSPFIAKIMSLLGLPVTGIAVIIRNEAYVPIGKSGKIEIRPRETLRKWIKLDTGRNLPLTSYVCLEGREVKYAGCMKAFRGVLHQVVPDWSTLDTPSSLMSKMLDGRTFY